MGTGPAAYSADLPPGFALPAATLFCGERGSAGCLAAHGLTAARTRAAAQAVG